MYYSSKFKEYSKDMRKTWVTIRSLIGTKKRRENIPEYFKHDGKILTETAQIAEGFNTFFSEIGPELASSINGSDKHYSDFLGAQVDENFIFATVTPDILIQIAGKLKGKGSFGADTKAQTNTCSQITALYVFYLAFLNCS